MNNHRAQPTSLMAGSVSERDTVSRSFPPASGPLLDTVSRSDEEVAMSAMGFYRWTLIPSYFSRPMVLIMGSTIVDQFQVVDK